MHESNKQECSTVIYPNDFLNKYKAKQCLANFRLHTLQGMAWKSVLPYNYLLNNF